jgi:hypothetical protein
MELCLPLIADELRFPIRFNNSEIWTSGLTLGRFAFLNRDEVPEKSTLYIATTEIMRDLTSFGSGNAFICVGALPDKLKTAQAPIVAYDEDTNVFDLANRLSRIFERWNQLDNRLTDALIKGYGYQYMADIFMPYIGNELTVVDSEFTILAHTFDTDKIPDTCGFAPPDKNNLLPMELINICKTSRAFASLKTLREPFIFDEGIFNNRCLCKNIIFENEYVCRIIINEIEQSIRPYDKYILDHFSEYIKRLYSSSVTGPVDEDPSNLSQMLYNTLEGAGSNKSALENAMRARGWHNGAHLLCVCIMPSPGDYANKTLHYYSEYINSHGVGITAFEYRLHIYCLINLENYGGTVESLGERFITLMRDNDFRAGISDVFTDLSEFRHKCRQASIALETGMDIDPTKWYFRFSEQILNKIIQLLRSSEAGEVLCSDAITSLLEYDHKNNTAYIDTLKAYFANNLNAVRTAKALYVHRGTLLHRLERIKDISGIDFDDADKNLYYQLSLRMLN